MVNQSGQPGLTADELRMSGSGCSRQRPRVTKRRRKGWSWSAHACAGRLPSMLGLIVLALIIWLVVSVLGLVIEGLFWLFVVGIVLFLATAAYGWVKRKA